MKIWFSHNRAGGVLWVRVGSLYIRAAWNGLAVYWHDNGLLIDSWGLQLIRKGRAIFNLDT